MDKITKGFSRDIKANEGERAVTARISTSVVDRDGEVLVPQGMNSKDFEKNPIVFFNHDYCTMPVGKVAALKRDTDAIVAKIIFAKRPDGHPGEWFPDTLLSLFQQNVLKGFSVGFIPKESRPATQKDIEHYGAGCGRVYSKWNLLELSVAPIPANQEAVALAVSKGIVKAPMAKAIWNYKQGDAIVGEPVINVQLGGKWKDVRAEPINKPAVVHVHRVLMPQTNTPETIVRHAVVATIQKRSGKIYAD